MSELFFYEFGACGHGQLGCSAEKLHRCQAGPCTPSSGGGAFAMDEELSSSSSSSGTPGNVMRPMDLLQCLDSPFAPLRVCAGERFVVALSEDGRVYSWGDSEHLQLGRAGKTQSPQAITTLETFNIVNVSCGWTHAAVVTDDGSVYSWGSNLHGELGSAALPLGESRGKPHRMKIAPSGTVQVGKKVHRNLRGCSAGGLVDFSLVVAGRSFAYGLTSGGIVASWGVGKEGQLGNGDVLDARSPSVIYSLLSVPVVEIACGEAHALFRTVDGEVHATGRNANGQLGLGHTRTIFRPVNVSTINGSHVAELTWGAVKISCGGAHSCAVTKKGTLYTWGSGNYGQLGHGCNADQHVPRAIAELMGLRVLDVGCGSRHTLALVGAAPRVRASSTGSVETRVYAWGYAATGALGLANIEAKSVSVPEEVSFPSPLPPPHMCGIACGADFSVVYRARGSVEQSVDAHSSHLGSFSPATLSPSSLGRYFNFASKVMSDLSITVMTYTHANQLLRDGRVDDLLARCTQSFGNPACLNASFLSKLEDADEVIETKSHSIERSRTSLLEPPPHGVSLSRIRMTFSMFEASAHHERINGAINRAIRCLITLLPDCSLSSVTSLRLFLVLPECSIFASPAVHQDVLSTFVNAITTLPHSSSTTLIYWWSQMERIFLLRVLSCLNDYLSFLLRRNGSPGSIAQVTRVIEMVYEANKMGMSVVPYQFFHNGAVNSEVVRLDHEYERWMAPNQRTFSLLRYPFLFNAESKKLLMIIDARVHMMSSIGEALLNAMPPVSIIRVRRDHVVSDAIRFFESAKGPQLFRPLHVVFEGEEALDEGGVKKELFYLLVSALFAPDYGLFTYSPETGVYWVNPHSQDEEAMRSFHFAGLILGLAIYNGVILDVRLPKVAYRMLVDDRTPLSLEDLRNVQKPLAESLSSILEMPEEDVEGLDLTFEAPYRIFGETKYDPLVEDGSNIAVTGDNRRKYVHTYTDYVLRSSVAKQFKAFRAGFFMACNERILKLCNPAEVELLVCGRAVTSLVDVEASAVYHEPYSKSHPTIVLFWRVVHSLSVEQQRRFLYFATGCERAPIGGASKIKLRIQRSGGARAEEDGEARDTPLLPVAHTCMNLLDLPEYHTEEEMRKAILLCVEHSVGFGIV